jgi:dTDP-4-amino-4,6-dideoxygalactose transaminase
METPNPYPDGLRPSGNGPQRSQSSTMPGRIPFVDLLPQYRELKAETDAAVAEIIQTSAFIQGPAVKEFEHALAASIGVRHAVGVANATSALMMTLKAMGVKDGDEVITTPLTAFPTAEAIALNGAKVVFADIDPKTYQIDPAEIERRITPRTKAIVPVHLYGIPVNLPAILEIAGRHNIPVLEDCAQAQGAEINGRRVGSMGVAGCYSFFPSKNLGCWGDGGAMATDDEAIAKFVRMYANHGRIDKFSHEIVGANERLDTLHAAVLKLKLARLDAWNSMRRDVAAVYRRHLAGVDEVVLPETYPGGTPVWHLFVIRAANRDGLAAFLKEKGIGTGLHYPSSLHLQPAMAKDYKKGDLPVVERATDEILSIPMYPRLSAEDAMRVCDEIKAFYAKPAPPDAGR